MTEIYTVKDKWGYWWSSAASAEEGYLIQKPGWGAVTTELRALDHVIQNYGILDDGEAFDFDAWAEEALKRTVKPAKAIPLQEFEKPTPEPEPEYDGIQALHDLVAANPGDPINWVISDRALVEFAEKLWEAAYDQGAGDLAECCGCSEGATTPNPFKEIYADDE